MEQTKSQRIKVSMNHGLVIGLILIGFAFLLNQANKSTNSLLPMLQWIGVIGSVYYSMKTWRDKYCGGYLSYSQAMGFGIRTMFYASIIYGFYSMLYMNWINPGAVDEAMTALEEGYYAMGFNDEQIEQFIVVAQKMQTPVWQVITTVIGTTFAGLILSLIVALFIKKEKDPFQTAMDRITEDPPQETI